MGAFRGAAWWFMAVIIAIHLCYKLAMYWLCGILQSARWWRKGMKIPHLTQTRLNVSYMDLYIVLKTAAMQTKQWSHLTSVYHFKQWTWHLLVTMLTSVRKSNLSTTPTLGTEEGGHCREVFNMGRYSKGVMWDLFFSFRGCLLQHATQQKQSDTHVMLLKLQI